jgi:putative ATP-dependent endonuclease of the OLD family
MPFDEVAMKISSIEITNFRSIKKESIDCGAFNTFVGPNGSGKSTVLNALNVFFGETNIFYAEDFHGRDTSKPIIIKVVFHELGTKAAEEFKHYVRGGLLVVQVEISAVEGDTFKKLVRGERLIFEPFKSFFEAGTATLRGKVFSELRDKYPDIEAATNDAARRDALSLFEEGLPESEKVLSLSDAEFFGVSKGSHKFQRHVSWVYVPAVKDASSESEEAKASHLGKLIQHTIRAGMNYETDLERIRSEALAAYSTLLDGQRTHLTALQQRLAARLQAAVTAETDLMLDWKKGEKSVSVLDPVAQVLLTDRGFSGEVDKFGHGLQRSFLLVILQELMAVDTDLSPTLILGCEEPELYQHPPQARHLAEVLMELSAGDAQVFITTHSPYFVDVDHYDRVKMFRNIGGVVSVKGSSFSTIVTSYNTAFSKPLRGEDQARAKLAIQTQPKCNEVFFSDKVVLVEGISDLACFEAFLRLSGRRAEFQKSGTSFLVCEGKSSLALMLLIAKDFGIPYYVIFDCDAGCRAETQSLHIRDNDAILTTAGSGSLGALPTKNLLGANFAAWHHDIERILEDEYGVDSIAFNQAGRDAVGSLADSKKNPLYVAAAMKAAWDAGRRFPIFDQVISDILKQ